MCYYNCYLINVKMTTWVMIFHSPNSRNKLRSEADFQLYVLKNKAFLVYYSVYYYICTRIPTTRNETEL